jgi:hypothetical protein
MQAIQKAFVTHKSLKAKATSIEEQPQYQNTAEARQSVASPSAPVIQEPAAVQTPAKSLQRQPSFRGDFGSKLLLVFCSHGPDCVVVVVVAAPVPPQYSAEYEAVVAEFEDVTVSCHLASHFFSYFFFLSLIN